MMARRQFLAVVFVLLSGPTSPAHAQLEYSVIDQVQGFSSPVALTEVFDTPYGRAIVQKAGRALMSGADARCVAEKGLDEARFLAAARQLIGAAHDVRLRSFVDAIDRTKANAAFHATVSADAVARVNRMFGPNAPEPNRIAVRRHVGAQMLDGAVEFAQQSTRLLGLQLPKAFSALQDGDGEVLELGEKQSDAYTAIVDAYDVQSPEVLALAAVGDGIKVAISQASDTAKVMAFGPSQLFARIRPVLLAHCLNTRG